MPPDPARPPAPAHRLASIDLLRGLAIILMALDHARDYFAPFPHQPEDLTQSSPALFLTRWVTHFCAPVFVFLAGVSIRLRQFPPEAGPADLASGGGPRPAGRPGMSRFLLTRGAFLIVLELTLIGASWGFLFAGIFTLQVIWALGVSMIVMAGLVRLPPIVSLILGGAMVSLHNLLDPITIQSLRDDGLAWLAPLWSILHEQQFFSLRPGAPSPFTPPSVFIVYPLIPWIGVMALGYGLAPIMRLEPPRRARACLLLGGAACIAFLILRAANLYGDPRPFDVNPPGQPILALLNTTKYPPSLQFLLMTIGPALLAIPLLERLRGPVAAFLLTFGRVPLFFYILHIPLLHIASAILWYALFGVISGWQIDSETFPDGYTPRLWVAFVAWAAAVAILYPPCRWFMRLKARRKDAWLSYL